MPKPKRKVRGGTCWAVIGDDMDHPYALYSNKETSREWYLPQHGRLVRIRWREVLPTPRARKAKR